MAKLPKWPKQPKRTSSLAVWQRYEQKVKAVKAKRKAIQEAPKKKEAIAERARKAKS